MTVKPPRVKPSKPVHARADSTGRKPPSRLARLALSGCLLLTTCGLGTAMICLYLVGSPPPLRVSVLWVNGNENAIRLCVFGLGIAAVSTLTAHCVRRHRWLFAMLWIAAFVAAAAFFSDRVRVIVRVLVEHYL